MRKLLSMLGIGGAATTIAARSPRYMPYTADSANFMYNLLFCDDAEAFRPATGELEGPFAVLFSEPISIASLEALANDDAQEGRLRYLAFARLRAAGGPAPPKKLLGVIVEVPLSGGLDVLAAYSEGGVRYINQTGKLAVVEGVTDVQPLVERLFASSEAIVNQIGPWDKNRLPPPEAGNVRLTFLVSDGLYFGEGPMTAMQRDAMAGPLIASAATLLQEVVRLGSPPPPALEPAMPNKLI
jgi:hypothetical protein